MLVLIVELNEAFVRTWPVSTSLGWSFYVLIAVLASQHHKNRATWMRLLQCCAGFVACAKWSAPSLPPVIVQTFSSACCAWKLWINRPFFLVNSDSDCLIFYSWMEKRSNCALRGAESLELKSASSRICFQVKSFIIQWWDQLHFPFILNFVIKKSPSNLSESPLVFLPNTGIRQHFFNYLRKMILWLIFVNRRSVSTSPSAFLCTQFLFLFVRPAFC